MQCHTVKRVQRAQIRACLLLSRRVDYVVLIIIFTMKPKRL